MLDSIQREARYLAQTGRVTLTPRQERRMKRKANHQMEEAAARREGVAKVRALRAGLRKARLAGLVSTP